MSMLFILEKKDRLRFKFLKIRCSLVFLLIVSLFYSCEKNEHEDDNDIKPAETHKSPKRGVSFSFQLVSDVELLSKGISWSYNWGVDQNNTLDMLLVNNDIDFVPMAWNANFNENKIRTYVLTHPKCKYLLAFNEPNLTKQANLTPSQAAFYWPKLKSLAGELKLKIISPAVNYGSLQNYADPIKWLDDFFDLIPISDVDGIAIHCYMSSPYALREYVSRFKKYSKPIWLTEFCAYDQSVRSVSDQMKYMCNVINYLESDSTIFRYAWFIPRGDDLDGVYPFNYLLTKTKPFQLTPLGNVFVNMSSQDKLSYYSVNQTVEAEHYSSVSVVDGNGTSYWVDAPTLQPTTDADGGLELCNFFENQWVEYQFNVINSDYYDIEFRYSCFLDSQLDISVDGNSVFQITLPSTNNETVWNTTRKNLFINQGKHTIRLRLNKGRVCLNWIKLKRSRLDF